MLPIFVLIKYAAKEDKKSAVGIPDLEEYGELKKLPVDKILPWVVQKHKAERAGLHYDIRFGPPEYGLFSFVSRKGLPKPGEKFLVKRTQLHEGQYANFEGKILRGYGKGQVWIHDKGAILVTKVDPNKEIRFVVLHHKYPEKYVMIKRKGKVPKDEEWYLINVTPTKPIKYEKTHYTLISNDDVEKLFDEGWLGSAKIDGAGALFKLFGDRIEALSIRTTKEGMPILYTYKIGGLHKGIHIPSKYVGTILRGEVYGIWTKGKKKGWAVPNRILSGLLNMSTLKSLQQQKKQNIVLKAILFDILQLKRGKKPPESYEEKLKILKDILKYLPKEKFHLAPMAAGEKAKEMWRQIKAKKYPLTEEGVVLFNLKGGIPLKAKLFKEKDVYFRGVFPGQGRLKDRAGGMYYSLTPTGPIVGRMAGKLSDDFRKWLWEHRNDPELLGRRIVVQYQEQFPSGALRAPVFLAFHEDYPAVSVKPVSVAEAEKQIRAVKRGEL